MQPKPWEGAGDGVSAAEGETLEDGEPLGSGLGVLAGTVSQRKPHCRGLGCEWEQRRGAQQG